MALSKFSAPEPACYPVDWKNNEKKLFLKPAANPAKIGFQCTAGDLGKWAARFRLAKSFKGIDTGTEYNTARTPIQYGCIFRIFLVFSALEQYCRCLGIKVHEEAKLKAMQDQVGQVAALMAIRSSDKKYYFFKFVREKLDDARMKARMNSFIGGTHENVSFLARSVRHVFVHGHLAAGSVEIEQQAMEGISISVSELLLNAMEFDFKSKVSNL